MEPDQRGDGGMDGLATSELLEVYISMCEFSAAKLWNGERFIEHNGRLH